ncbi:putative dehydrogenase [Pseudomonas sp. M47T1]|nr:putative dehydrogenase [Pseudomonas sp. M47T1]
MAGLGAALARRFAQGGYRVTVSGRSADKLHAVVGSIEQQGGTALALPGDAGNEADILQAVGRIKAFGRLRVAIFNVGNAVVRPVNYTYDPPDGQPRRRGTLQSTHVEIHNAHPPRMRRPGAALNCAPWSSTPTDNPQRAGKPPRCRCRQAALAGLYTKAPQRGAGPAQPAAAVTRYGAASRPSIHATAPAAGQWRRSLPKKPPPCKAASAALHRQTPLYQRCPAALRPRRTRCPAPACLAPDTPASILPMPGPGSGQTLPRFHARPFAAAFRHLRGRRRAGPTGRARGCWACRRAGRSVSGRHTVKRSWHRRKAWQFLVKGRATV